MKGEEISVSQTVLEYAYKREMRPTRAIGAGSLEDSSTALKPALGEKGMIKAPFTSFQDELGAPTSASPNYFLQPDAVH